MNPIPTLIVASISFLGLVVCIVVGLCRAAREENREKLEVAERFLEDRRLSLTPPSEPNDFEWEGWEPRLADLRPLASGVHTRSARDGSTSGRMTQRR